MIAKVLLLALLVAATSASPLTGSVNYIEAFGTFLRAFQKMAPCGFAPWNLPVFEPLTNEFSTFNYTKGDTSLVGNASNIRISGLSEFIVLNGQYDTTTQRASFDVMFPELQILGSTVFDGTFSVLGFSFPTHQNTLLNERLEQLRFVGAYTFAPSLTNPKGLRIVDLDLQFYVADVKIDNWDTLWSIATNTFYDRWSSELISLFVKEIQPSVDQLLADYVVPDINDLLSNVSMTDVTNFFMNTAKEWNKVECDVHA
ncbi:GH13839 [Drosophila grimshawi]|uniref:GH13839 n=1 Tax=Drosophila grimshawi TaxID=7222 RepID=B4JTQ5_DROGR|nr:GH13839 [Drosophila grimshawi]